VAFRLILMLLFYELFKPVNKSINLLAVFFNIVATTMQAVMAVTLLAPLVLLGGLHSLTVLPPEQAHALALAALQLYNPIYYIALAFFGCYDLLLGYLAFKSTFLPRPIGVLLGIAGLGWLTFFVPPIATHLLPYNVFAGLIGEGLTILWLLVKSVNPQKWREQESRAWKPESRVKGEAAV
jgi:ABC-type transport system involved in multi-copper enzyme maturation permease subunit